MGSGQLLLTALPGSLQTEFRLGVRFYSEEQPAAAVLHLEKALQEYFVADTECRALCEGPYDYEGYNYLEYNADLFQAMTGGSACAKPCVRGRDQNSLWGEHSSHPGPDCAAQSCGCPVPGGVQGQNTFWSTAPAWLGHPLLPILLQHTRHGDTGDKRHR